MNITASHINRILVQADIEGLIAAGAPEDEYIAEAGQVAEAISELAEGQLNYDVLLSIISLIWAQYFKLSPAEFELRLPIIRQTTEKILRLDA